MITSGLAGGKLFWDTKLTIFNKTFTLDDNTTSAESENNSNNSNNSNNNELSSNTNNNEISSSSSNTNTNKSKQLYFLTKKSARNELATRILKDIDLPAYEEMLLNQENVKKTLQNYRDGVLSGKY